MLDLGWEVLALLVAAGFVAGFIDSIAGGGGLIGVPVLLLAMMLNHLISRLQARRRG